MRGRLPGKSKTADIIAASRAGLSLPTIALATGSALATVYAVLETARADGAIATSSMAPRTSHQPRTWTPTPSSMPPRIVELAIAGRSPREIAAELGCSQSAARYWMGKAAEDGRDFPQIRRNKKHISVHW